MKLKKKKMSWRKRYFLAGRIMLNGRIRKGVR